MRRSASRRARRSAVILAAALAVSLNGAAALASPQARAAHSNAPRLTGPRIAASGTLRLIADVHRVWAKEQVDIQVLVGRRWETVRKGSVRRTGAIPVAVRVVGPANARFRAVEVAPHERALASPVLVVAILAPPPPPAPAAPAAPATSPVVQVAAPTPAAASTPQTAFLADLTATTGYPDSGDYTVDGADQPRSIALQVSGYTGEVEYNLGRQWNRLTANLGISDDQLSGPEMDVEIFGDGRSLFRARVGVGQLVPVNIDVSGDETLDIDYSSDSQTEVVLGQAQLSTLPAAQAADPSAPVVTFLDARNDVTGNSGNGVYHLNGTFEPNTVSVEAECCGYDDANYAEFDLGRAFGHLQTTLGLDDSDSSTASANVTITGDGTTLWSGSVSVGNDVPLDLPVSGVLRLGISVETDTDDVDALLTDARLTNP